MLPKMYGYSKRWRDSQVIIPEFESSSYFLTLWLLDKFYPSSPSLNVITNNTVIIRHGSVQSLRWKNVILKWFCKLLNLTDRYCIIMGKNTEAADDSSVHKRQMMFELMEQSLSMGIIHHLLFSLWWGIVLRCANLILNKTDTNNHCLHVAYRLILIKWMMSI